MSNCTLVYTPIIYYRSLVALEMIYRFCLTQLGRIDNEDFSVNLVKFLLESLSFATDAAPPQGRCCIRAMMNERRTALILSFTEINFCYAIASL